MVLPYTTIHKCSEDKGICPTVPSHYQMQMTLASLHTQSAARTAQNQMIQSLLWYYGRYKVISLLFLILLLQLYILLCSFPSLFLCACFVSLNFPPLFCLPSRWGNEMTGLIPDGKEPYQGFTWGPNIWKAGMDHWAMGKVSSEVDTSGWRGKQACVTLVMSLISFFCSFSGVPELQLSDCNSEPGLPLM